MYLVITLISIAAGLVQGVAGFGAGIVAMIVLPYFFLLPKAAAVSTCINLVINFSMTWSYRKELSLRKVILPVLMFVIFSSLSIRASQYIDQHILKKMFAVFLIVLSIYYLFIKKDGEAKKIGLPMTVLYMAVSGACDGMFAIGGPLVVLYYLAETESPREYLGTIQCFFLLAGIYNTCFRIWNGILRTELLLPILFGGIGIFLGAMAARKLVDRMNRDLLTKIIYITIGISGIINLF